MSIPAEDLVKVAYWREITEVQAIEKYYTWEVKTYGQASANTKANRCYWLEKLLQRQLREFDRD